jgi:hypothetical protein
MTRPAIGTAARAIPAGAAAVLNWRAEIIGTTWKNSASRNFNLGFQLQGWLLTSNPSEPTVPHGTH